MPLYTPEPDICHELIGHAPALAVKEIADLTQAIGVAVGRIAVSPSAHELAYGFISKGLVHN